MRKICADASAGLRSAALMKGQPHGLVWRCFGAGVWTRCTASTLFFFRVDSKPGIDRLSTEVRLKEKLLCAEFLCEASDPIDLGLSWNVTGAVVGRAGLERELDDIAVANRRIFRSDLLVDRDERFAAVDVLKQGAQ